MKPSSSHTTLKIKSLVLSGSQSCFSTLLPRPRPFRPPEPMAYRLCLVWGFSFSRSSDHVFRRFCRYSIEFTWVSSVSSSSAAVPAPAHVMIPPLPLIIRMVPTMAVVSRMPDMCGSMISSTSTGTSGSTGRMICRTMRMNSQSFSRTFSFRDGRNRPICGALDARCAVSRIISNLATSEVCRVSPPRRIQRRQPFSGGKASVAASMSSTIQ